MRLSLALFGLLLGSAAQAQVPFDMARSVTNVAGMRQLAGWAFPPGYPDTADVSDFCEGVFEPPGFYFLDVSLRSGLLYTEAFIYQGTRDSLRLRAHLPARYFVWRKAEWTDGKLIVSELPYSEIDKTNPNATRTWHTVLELLP